MCGPPPDAPRAQDAIARVQTSGNDGVTTSYVPVSREDDAAWYAAKRAQYDRDHMPTTRVGSYTMHFAECAYHVWRGPIRYSSDHADTDASIHERTYHAD